MAARPARSGRHRSDGSTTNVEHPTFVVCLSGCHTRSSATTATIEATLLARSTSHGPCQLLTANCVMPKLAPQTKHAGHTSRIPRQPTCAATSQNGTSSEKNGNCRPTIELSA
jgi:hypothetical protein